MTLAQYRRRFPNIDWSRPSPAAEFAMKPKDVDAVFAEMDLLNMNPGPAFFRDAAIAAAGARRVPLGVTPRTRYWVERALGLKPDQGMFGFGPYKRPNHARVITFLWLELLATEQR